ncbi:unnamed protein product [Adineta steineri]|uniref:Uncharacterized protein n=1 Tax=Adineta steineri TaxID=433720 RepID=A0A813XTV5_9BILA|nr:unnamed protein product [Adineta steineri]
MSMQKQWPELVGQSFEQASQVILAFDSNLHPYNARNGMENYMFDPLRVSCVTNDNDIVTQTPSYTYRS